MVLLLVFLFVQNQKMTSLPAFSFTPLFSLTLCSATIFPPSFISYIFLYSFSLPCSLHSVLLLFFCFFSPAAAGLGFVRAAVITVIFSPSVSPLLSVGGVFVLGTYTILFLKLYSYKDVNMWCRELSAAKAKKLARSLSCKFPTAVSACVCVSARVWRVEVCLLTVFQLSVASCSCCYSDT